jgi:hypothetical protein
MIALFIIIIMAIALIATAGYGIMALMDSSSIAINLQRNVVRLDIIGSAIRAGIRMEDGRVLVPVSNDYSTRLTTSVAPFSKTTWGKDIIYCPVSPNGPVAGNEEHILGDDYSVTTRIVGGLTYVSGGGPGDQTLLEIMRARHVIALLISPDINGSHPTPKCSDVTFANEMFSVTGGDVTPINDVQTAGNGFGRVFVLSATGDIPPGAIAINSVESAASYITNYGLPDATIRLPAGVHPIGYKAFVDLQEAVSGRTIRLIGSGGAVLKVDYANAAGIASDALMRVNGTMEITGVAIKGYKGDVEAVDIVADIAPAGVLSLIDASVGGLRVSGGKAYLGSGSTVSPLYSAAARAEPVIAFGGQIFAAANTNAVVSSSAALFGMKASGGDIAVAGPIFMSLAPSGKAFATFGGGRVTAGSSSATVRVNLAAAAAVEPSITMSDKVSLSGTGLKRNLVTSGVIACADGAASCDAVCPQDSVIAWGECGSSNGHPLASFGADDAGAGWSCRWSVPAGVVAPTAKAVCTALP